MKGEPSSRMDLVSKGCHRKLCSPFHHGGTVKRQHVCEIRPSLDSDPTNALILDHQAAKATLNKLLLFVSDPLDGTCYCSLNGTN